MYVCMFVYIYIHIKYDFVVPAFLGSGFLGLAVRVSGFRVGSLKVRVQGFWIRGLSVQGLRVYICCRV